ncbi:transcriptional regulator FtrA [Stenotrophomonas rhizophila]|uniref:transcriptional regulator FtrA n=1 Tax=Stenotrophomonas rhizophila TaxID=216778 RepID=UPI00081C744E|nr:transcriptional regulator FtrA [Stenotrophomonas rhizophila]AOA72406.1 hypothetical protein BAY15_1972 [Stenotrophomonas rhizophila]
MNDVRLNPASPEPGLVAVLVYDGLCLFEFGIAAELFGLPRSELGVPWYSFAVVSADRTVRSAVGGLVLQAARSLEALESARTIVIPGWKGADAAPSTRLRQALIKAHARGARFVTICSGAFLLAHCGLLEQRRATTHWRYADAFAARFPQVELIPDVLFVQDGNVITSAGSAAGIDACMHLIREDFGAKIANRVAQRLVVPPQRGGGQRQFIPSPVPEREGGRFEGVFDWARQRLTQPIGAVDLARAAAMSERNFFRRFKEATGTSPSQWLLNERVSLAREFLEAQPGWPLERISRSSGFSSLETFRVAFRKVVGVPPSRYREQFGS